MPKALFLEVGVEEEAVVVVVVAAAAVVVVVGVGVRSKE